MKQALLVIGAVLAVLCYPLLFPYTPDTEHIAEPGKPPPAEVVDAVPEKAGCKPRAGKPGAGAPAGPCPDTTQTTGHAPLTAQHLP